MNEITMFLLVSVAIIGVAGVTFLMVIVSDQLKEIREEKRRNDVTKGIRR